MSSPLRAFLMLRDPAEGWSISVHREMEEILAAWSAKASVAGVGAVLHVGFQRPLSKHFDEMVDRYPGEVLVTESAKHALPPNFRSSSAPVGSVEGLPVSRGLSGWGYEVSEVSQENVPAPARQITEDWILAFIRLNPEAKDLLIGSGITTDKEYVEIEGLLPASVRSEMAHFRFSCLSGPGTADPLRSIRLLPPWIASIAIDQLEVPVRVRNALRTVSIEFVRDLGKWSVEDLRKVPNFGKKCVDDLRDALQALLIRGVHSDGTRMEVAQRTELLTSIHQSIARFTEREKDVVRRRMGLSGLASGPETLQQIADDYSLTRERIRQLEARAVKRLVDEELWDDVFTMKMRSLVAGREFPLPLLGVEALDSWFNGVAEHPHAVEYLLKNVCTSGITLVDIDGTKYLSFVTQDKWESTLREARRLLASNASRKWSKERCEMLVRGLLPVEGAEFRKILWDLASKHCHFSIAQNGEVVLTSVGRGADQVVESVLLEAVKPLHFTEIASEASRRSGRVIDVRRAHNAAAAVGILLGRGTYGAERHLPLDRSQMELLSEEAESIVMASEARQWHCGELLSELIDRGSVEASQADRFVLDYALRQFSGLSGLKRMVWTRDADAQSAAQRIDVHQAILAVVAQSDRPLRASELRHRLVALRGIGSHFQIHPRDPLIRVGTALWGLNDRDLPVKRDDQAPMIDALAEQLEWKGKGVHVSEIGDLDFESLRACPAEAVFCLALYDVRFKISHSQYVYLSKWEGPRRLSVTEAVDQALASADSALPVHEVHNRAAALVGRPLERVTVSSCLQQMGAVLDERGHWRRAPEAEAEAEYEDEAEVTLADQGDDADWIGDTRVVDTVPLDE